MKILLPTAKTMKKYDVIKKIEGSYNTKLVEEDIPSLYNYQNAEKIKEILKVLKEKSVEEYIKIFKIDEKKALEEKENIIQLYNWSKQNNKEIIKTPAIIYFDGLMYKNINAKPEEIYENEIKYKKIYITSSLYGIISSDTKIARHRLDFAQKIEGLDLKKIWKEIYNKFMEENDEPVLSLLSSEFQEIFDKQNTDKMIQVRFEKNGKVGSTLAKQMRGKITRYCIDKGILEKGIEELEEILEELKKFNEDNIRYNEEKSIITKEKILLVYEKN